MITLCTHSACLSPDARLGHAFAEVGDVAKRAGVTYRDIRMAYKAEAIFEQILENASHPYTFRMRGPQARPESIGELLHQYRESHGLIRKRMAYKGKSKAESLVSASISCGCAWIVSNEPHRIWITSKYDSKSHSLLSHS